jgi:Tol biopolymer transport system component
MKRAITLTLLIFLLVACSGKATAVPPPTLPPTNTPANTLCAVELAAGEQTLVQINLITGERTPILLVPPNGWLSSFDLSPDGRQFVLAYAPPPPAGEINYGFTSLYLLPLGETEPRLLLAAGGEGELFFRPAWSADGQAIYFSHITPLDQEAYTFATTLKRLNPASGAIDLIAENGIWPRPSPDGRMLAYVHVDPETQANSLVVTEADGASARELVAGDVFTAVDAPVFTPDNQMLYFSASEPASVRSWWEILTGVQVAVAHNLPSDWYRIPVAGGEAERLTELDGVGLYGRFSPQNPTIFAFASQSGLYLMSANGEDAHKAQEGVFTDSLAWRP